jgi:tetratricopeptide (TPR) repeat protein
VYGALGDEARSIELYELAIEKLELLPTRYLVEAYSKLAELLERRGDKDAALALLKQAMNVQTQTERMLGERETV